VLQIGKTKTYQHPCVFLKEAIVEYSKYYLDICSEGLKKTTENIIQDIQCPGRDSRRRPPKQTPRALPLYMKPYSLVDICRRFEGNFWLHFKVAHSAEREESSTDTGNDGTKTLSEPIVVKNIPSLICLPPGSEWTGEIFRQ
jgi:hypothetical protein